MKFLLDAQLPPRLAQELRVHGHDTLHTIHLPLRNRTPDGDIADLATMEGRVLVTKDSDFVTSFLLHRRPHKLLLISTGPHVFFNNRCDRDVITLVIEGQLTTCVL